MPFVDLLFERGRRGVGDNLRTRARIGRRHDHLRRRDVVGQLGDGQEAERDRAGQRVRASVRREASSAAGSTRSAAITAWTSGSAMSSASVGAWRKPLIGDFLQIGHALIVSLRP